MRHLLYLFYFEKLFFIKFLVLYFEKLVLSASIWCVCKVKLWITFIRIFNNYFFLIDLGKENMFVSSWTWMFSVFSSNSGTKVIPQHAHDSWPSLCSCTAEWSYEPVCPLTRPCSSGQSDIFQESSHQAKQLTKERHFFSSHNLKQRQKKGKCVLKSKTLVNNIQSSLRVEMTL